MVEVMVEVVVVMVEVVVVGGLCRKAQSSVLLV